MRGTMTIIDVWDNNEQRKLDLDIIELHRVDITDNDNMPLIVMEICLSLSIDIINGLFVIQSTDMYDLLRKTVINHLTLISMDDDTDKHIIRSTYLSDGKELYSYKAGESIPCNRLEYIIESITKYSDKLAGR